MSTPTPETVKHGFVQGRIVLSVGDDSDEDQLPNAVPAVGAVSFTALNRITREYEAVPPTTVVGTRVTRALDENGVLVNTDGTPGIWLSVGPHKVAYLLDDVEIPRHDIEVTELHTPDNPLDLTEAIPPGGPVLTPTEYADLMSKFTTLETKVVASVAAPAAQASIDAASASASATSASSSATSALNSANAADADRIAAEAAKLSAQAAKESAAISETSAVQAAVASIAARDISVSAKDTSVAAKNDAVIAKTAADTARGLAQTAATTATTKAGEANDSADAASLSAQSAAVTAIAVNNNLANMIEDAEIVNNDLILKKHDLSELNVGRVVGDTGIVEQETAPTNTEVLWLDPNEDHDLIQFGTEGATPGDVVILNDLGEPEWGQIDLGDISLGKLRGIVTVQTEAWDSAVISVNVETNIWTIVGHTLSNGDVVAIHSKNTMSYPSSARQAGCYLTVAAVAGDTFKLQYAGADVDYTSAGSTAANAWFLCREPGASLLGSAFVTVLKPVASGKVRVLMRGNYANASGLNKSLAFGINNGGGALVTPIGNEDQFFADLVAEIDPLGEDITMARLYGFSSLLGSSAAFTIAAFQRGGNLGIYGDKRIYAVGLWSGGNNTTPSHGTKMWVYEL